MDIEEDNVKFGSYDKKPDFDMDVFILEAESGLSSYRYDVALFRFLVDAKERALEEYNRNRPVKIKNIDWKINKNKNALVCSADLGVVIYRIYKRKVH